MTEQVWMWLVTGWLAVVAVSAAGWAATHVFLWHERRARARLIEQAANLDRWLGDRR